jgi:signal transduction histidine kinase
MLTVWQQFKLFWTKIINIGVTDSLSFSERRRVHLLNGLGVIGNITVIFYMISILFLTPSNQQITEIDPFYYLNFVLVTTWSAVICLNSLHLHLLGRTLAFVIAIIFYTYVGFVSAKPYEGELFLILIAVATFVMFNRLYQIIPIFSLATGCFLFLLLNISIKNKLPDFNYIMSAGVYIRVITFFIFLFFTLQLYRVEYFTYQRAVEERNKELQEKNMEIIAQSEILESQTVELSKLNQTKDKLFSIISHDLRSPISAMKSLLDMYDEQQMPQEDFPSFSKYLKDNIDNLYLLLDNLLRWSQSQQKGINIRPSHFNLGELMNENMFVINTLCHNKKIVFINKILKDCVAFADKDHVLLILNNLISNAIKFTNRGGKIEINSEYQGDTLIISIIDNGVGMSEGQCLNLFQLNALSSRKGTLGELGTGLGLILVKEFVEKNGGKIWVQSQEGIGTTFYFSLAKGEVAS